MALRAAHGAAAENGTLAVIETLPVDELPRGVPAASEPTLPPSEHAHGFRAGDARTIELARRGGRSRAHRTALAHTLGVSTDDPVWCAYLRQAEAFRRAQVRQLASTVGGGVCGPAPAALIASAALALAGSRYRYSQGKITEGARLATEVRQHLLGAHELCAREAMARPDHGRVHPQHRSALAELFETGESTKEPDR